LALVLGSRVARAEPEFVVELVYRPDESLVGCPSEAEFRAMIRDQLGRDPFRAGAERQVVARAQATEQGLRGLVEWHDASGHPSGERELGSASADCRMLAREMGFAIAVQIQLLTQEAATTGEHSSKEAAAPASPSKTAVPEAAPLPSPAPDDRPPLGERHAAETAWRFVLGAGPAVAFGLAPRTAFVGRLFTGLQSGRLAAELAFEASLPVHYTTSNGDGFDQGVLAGSIAGCARWGGVSGCLLGKLGRLSVQGFGVDEPRSPAGTLVQAGPRVAFGHGFGERWFGALRLEAMATLAPWEVTLNQDEVWKTPLFSLTLGGDLGLVL
jgi:hypothetical protein